jgi:hypothetical protein
MNVSKRSDQVFQLSLTEIAFTIAFILLLLLGYLVMRESEAKKKAEEALAKVQDLGAAQQAFDQASARLQQDLAGAGATDPNEIISRLVAEAKAATERDRLQVRVKDLEAQISALAEVKQTVADATEDAGKKEAVERVVSALALQAQAEKAIEAAKDAASAPVSQPESAPQRPRAYAPTALAQGKSASEGNKRPAQRRPSAEETQAEVQKALQVTAAVDRALREAGAKPLPEGKEAETVAGMVRAAQSLRGLEGSGKGVEDVVKENSNLRGQLAFIRNQLNASAFGRGVEHLPCWTEGDRKIEYLFNIELRPRVAIITPAWPERRREDAAKLPNVSDLTSGPVSFDRFRTAARPILELSKRQDPECRHFVVINNTIESRPEADQARWMVEEFFYKREARK